MLRVQTKKVDLYPVRKKWEKSYYDHIMYIGENHTYTLMFIRMKHVLFDTYEIFSYEPTHEIDRYFLRIFLNYVNKRMNKQQIPVFHEHKQKLFFIFRKVNK